MAWIKISTKTTDENGKVVFDNLPYGNYKIQQTSAKMGYTPDSAETSVVIDSTEPKVITKTNVPAATGTLKVIKHSEGYPDLKLAGSKFKLMDSEGKIMLSESQASGADGEIILDNLMAIEGTPQTYKLVETTAPIGYNLVTGEQTGEVTVGATTELAVANTPTANGTLNVGLSDANYSEYALQGSDYDVYFEVPGV